MGFTAGSGWDLDRIWMGSGQDLDRIWMGSGIFAEIRPARTRPTALPCRPAEHAPTPTHPHTPAHVDAIDFNTPRLISFGKKTQDFFQK